MLKLYWNETAYTEPSQVFTSVSFQVAIQFKIILLKHRPPDKKSGPEKHLRKKKIEKTLGLELPLALPLALPLSLPALPKFPLIQKISFNSTLTTKYPTIYMIQTVLSTSEIISKILTVL